MAKQMQGKVCVITGGAGSIGLASAKLLHAEGAKVMLTDLDAAALKEAVAHIGGNSGRRQHRLVCGRRHQIGPGQKCNRHHGKPVRQDRRSVQQRRQFRHGRADQRISGRGFRPVLAVHVKGAFLAAKHAVPQMNDGGSIIITSSIVGRERRSRRLRLHHRQARPGRPDARAWPRSSRAETSASTRIHPGPVDNDFQLNVEKKLTGVIGRDGTAIFQRHHSAASSRPRRRSSALGALSRLRRLELHDRKLA